MPQWIIVWSLDDHVKIVKMPIVKTIPIMAHAMTHIATNGTLHCKVGDLANNA